MLKLILTSIFCFCSVFCLYSQQFADMMDIEEYTYHQNVDSIVSTRYIVNKYEGDEKDFKYTYQDKDFDLRAFETKVTVYTDPYSYTSSVHNKVTGQGNIMKLKFNKKGQYIYVEKVNPNDELFNQKTTFDYDEKGRVITRVRTGHNVMEYEAGNKEITTDTTLSIVYNDNNLVESGYFGSEFGLASEIESETKGDTIFYFSKMSMGDVMAEMLKDLKPNDIGIEEIDREPVMIAVYDKSTGNYKCYEKDSYKNEVQQTVDNFGNVVEKITLFREEVVRHEKFRYKDGVLNNVEVLAGESTGLEYNDLGQKISETTDYNTIKFIYDKDGNLKYQEFLNPYSLELDEVTVHKIYQSK